MYLFPFVIVIPLIFFILNMYISIIHYKESQNVTLFCVNWITTVLYNDILYIP